MINANSLLNPIPPDRLSLFALGFRPFFLAAGLAAVVLLAVWSMLLSGVELSVGYYGARLWHGHEMLFGFATAVIAGFLLTAVRNWTSQATPSGWPLAGLVGVWLLGRLLPLFHGHVPDLLIAAVDLAFLPLLALVLVGPILRSRKRPQLIFVAMLLLLASANLLIHLERLGVTAASALQGVTLAMNTILLLIMVMAGRVLPFFIERGAPGSQPGKWPWLERGAVGLMIVLVAVELVWPQPVLIGVVCVGLALSHGARLLGWYDRRVWRAPLLWVLVIGYGWLVVGMTLKGAEYLGLLTTPMSTHAFAAAIAVLCLGMMARVALGHTGRALQLANAMVASFITLIAAMVVRLVVPLLPSAWSALALGIAVTLWLGAFVIFLLVYFPILIRARVDGQPG